MSAGPAHLSVENGPAPPGKIGIGEWDTGREGDHFRRAGGGFAGQSCFIAHLGSRHADQKPDCLLRENRHVTRSPTIRQIFTKLIRLVNPFWSREFFMKTDRLVGSVADANGPIAGHAIGEYPTFRHPDFIKRICLDPAKSHPESNVRLHGTNSITGKGETKSHIYDKAFDVPIATKLLTIPMVVTIAPRTEILRETSNYLNQATAVIRNCPSEQDRVNPPGKFSQLSISPVLNPTDPLPDLKLGELLPTAEEIPHPV